MRPFQIFSGLLQLLVCTPIWYYLIYSILVAIHPDRLVWFLFWIYIPSGIFVITVRVIAESSADKKGAR